MAVDSKTLARTLDLRLELANALLDDNGKIGGALTGDPKTAKVFLAALDGIDKQVLTTARLEQEHDQSAQDRALLLEQTKVLENIARSVGNPFERVEGNEKAGVDPTSTADQLPAITLVEGQMDKGTSTLTHEEFMKKFADVDQDELLAEED